MHKKTNRKESRDRIIKAMKGELSYLGGTLSDKEFMKKCKRF